MSGQIRDAPNRLNRDLAIHDSLKLRLDGANPVSTNVPAAGRLRSSRQPSRSTAAAAVTGCGAKAAKKPSAEIRAMKEFQANRKTSLC